MSAANVVKRSDGRAPRRAVPSKHSPLGGLRITQSEKREGLFP